MITFDQAILFIDPAKLTDDVEDYLKAVGVETREYNDLWSYLRKREWGEGKVCFLFPRFLFPVLDLPLPSRSSSPQRHLTRLLSCLPISDTPYYLPTSAP